MPAEEKVAPVVAAVPATTSEVIPPKKATDTNAPEVTKKLSLEYSAADVEKPKNDTVTKDETKEEEKRKEDKTEEDKSEEIEKEEDNKEGDKNEEEGEKEGDIVRETESDSKLTATASKIESDDGETKKTEGVVLRKRRTPEKKESKDEDVSPPKRVK